MKSITIITPVYNDWKSFDSLLKDICNTPENDTYHIKNIIIVNDFSSEICNLDLSQYRNAITKLDLAINVGHQKAIAIGINYYRELINNKTDQIIIMDCDGEDKVSDIKVLSLTTTDKIVFASRKKRSESITFKLLYRCYRLFFKLLTGHNINFGNFSCIPDSLINSLAINPNIWNHYSASVIKSKIPFSSTPTIRGKRYHGKSKMNIRSLIIHGFSSISIFTDIIITNIFILILLFLSILSASFITILAINFFTNYAIPGWTSEILMSIINLGASLFIIVLLLLVQLNQSRTSLRPLSHYYKEYISNITIHENSK